MKIVGHLTNLSFCRSAKKRIREIKVINLFSKQHTVVHLGSCFPDPTLSLGGRGVREKLASTGGYLYPGTKNK